MADFMKLSGIRLQSLQTLAGRLKAAVRRTVLAAPAGQADHVVRSLARFLGSFGTTAENLMKMSTKKLADQTESQRLKMASLAISEITAQTKAGLQSALAKFKDGRLDLTGLRTEARALLRRQTIAAAIVGVGGAGNITENVLNAIRRQLTEQFTSLDGFLKDISGRALTQRDTARLSVFANATHSIAQLALRQYSYDVLLNNNEGLEERRLLGGSDQCDDCIELANEGWQPAGTLPAIGQDTVCGVNCRCTFDIRVVSSDDAAGSKGDAGPVQV